MGCVSQLTLFPLSLARSRSLARSADCRDTERLCPAPPARQPGIAHPQRASARSPTLHPGRCHSFCYFHCRFCSALADSISVWTLTMVWHQGQIRRAGSR
eukprot:2308773-Rhodomonas_salina.1